MEHIILKLQVSNYLIIFNDLKMAIKLIFILKCKAVNLQVVTVNDVKSQNLDRNLKKII